ncbi:hypothetical protein [Bacillus sp. CGMCC 1.16541]|uniref:hypothetical protein n=1 Tax=Bacillus sp. CGMCC 1.16541 TaxID=2185143 RepID=UPI000D73076A|nr:hypothetical protein [Bacillus sp. CGMCC 1.16541]
MKPHEQIELELYKDQLKKDERILFAAYPFVAKMTKSYYDQLIESGFNPEQALRIVCAHGYTAGFNSGGNNK